MMETIAALAALALLAAMPFAGPARSRFARLPGAGSGPAEGGRS